MNKQKQIKKAFDSETMRKIGKGALITAFYSIAVFILSMINGIDFNNSIVNALIVQVTPTILNALKEWYKGEIEINNES